MYDNFMHEMESSSDICIAESYNDYKNNVLKKKISALLTIEEGQVLEGCMNNLYDAYEKGLDIICQCEYGQSRSAGCAAAILEHFQGNGITIFRDYKYYPNKLIFNKVSKKEIKGFS